MIRALVRHFQVDRQGQGLAEYCLIIAFLALVAAAILVAVSGGLNNLWSIGNTTLTNAAQGSPGAAGGH